MDKKYMIVALILLVLILGGGVYYWKTKAQKPVMDVIYQVNPTESTQNANPYDKTNPYSDIKVNPFE